MGKTLVGHGRVLLVAALIVGTCAVVTTPGGASADADIARRAGGLSSRLAALVKADASGRAAVGETRDELSAEGPGSLMRSERGLVLELRTDELSDDVIEGIEAT